MIGDAKPARDVDRMYVTRWTNVSFDPFKKYNREYTWLKRFINVFLQHDIKLVASSGTLLGSRRHFGIIPWDNQDFDFMVLSTNTTMINYVLDTVLNIKWSYNTDGVGSGNGGFGYHIETPFKRYVDFWLYQNVTDKYIQCVGVSNGCKRWYNKYWKSDPPLFELKNIFPIIYIPFGPLMILGPYNVDYTLDIFYTDRWKTYCKGWRYGKQKCSSLYARYAFVIQNKENISTLQKGEKKYFSFNYSDIHNPYYVK